MNAADVKSIESLQDLHAAVAKFRAEAQDAIASVDLAVRRGHDYLSDQLRFWQAAIRTTEDEVFQAKQEFAQRKYVGFDGREPDTTVQVANLRARRRNCSTRTIKWTKYGNGSGNSRTPFPKPGTVPADNWLRSWKPNCRAASHCWNGGSFRSNNISRLTAPATGAVVGSASTAPEAPPPAAPTAENLPETTDQGPLTKDNPS